MKYLSDIARWLDDEVAPVRERGLKLLYASVPRRSSGRSRKGAWIEIFAYMCAHISNKRRSRKGAWIEIVATCGII